MASIERDVILNAPKEEVWRAVSDQAMLREWLAPEVELDAREGGEVLCRTADGESRPGLVRLVEEDERLVFDWSRDGPEPSRVEFRIQELDGRTRLTVTENELQANAADAASDGWRRREEA